MSEKCSLDLTAQKLGFFCVHNGAEYQIKFLLVPFCFISPIYQGFPDHPSGPCTPSKYDRGVVMVNTLVEPLLSLFIITFISPKIVSPSSILGQFIHRSSESYFL